MQTEVRTVTVPAELPQALRRWQWALPAAVFTSRTLDGRQLLQMRTLKLLKDEEHPEKGRGGYRFPTGQRNGFGVIQGQQPLVATTAAVLLLIEGSKQALAGACAIARSERLNGKAVAVRMCGIWGWKDKTRQPDGEVECLDRIPLRGREVVLVPDGDVATNPTVHTGATRLYEALQRRGVARVRVVRVPLSGPAQKTGLDDHLALQLPEERGRELERLLDAATEALPPPPKGAEPKTDKDRLAAVYAKAGELIADKDKVGTVDRLPLLRAYSQKVGIRMTDGELQRAVWKARRAARGAAEPMKPGDVLAGSDAEWAWEGMLLLAALNLLVGLPKSGKTSLMLDLIARWFRGEPEFLGRPLIGPCPPVLLVGVDMTEADWRRLLGQVGLLGEGNRLGGPIVGLFHKGRPLSLDPEGVETIADYAEKHPGLLVIADSYAELTRSLGFAEKDADFAEPAGDLLEAISPLGATLVLLHHAGKGLAGASTAEASRGTTALPALASQTLKIVGVARGENWAQDRRRILSSDGRGGEPVQLVVERVDGVWISHGSAEGVQREQQLKKVEEKLQGRNPLVLKAVRTRWEHHGETTTAKQAAEHLGFTSDNERRAISRNLHALQLKGFLRSRSGAVEGGGAVEEFWPAGVEAPPPGEGVEGPEPGVRVEDPWAETAEGEGERSDSESSITPRCVLPVRSFSKGGVRPPETGVSDRQERPGQEGRSDRLDTFYLSPRTREADWGESSTTPGPAEEDSIGHPPSDRTPPPGCQGELPLDPPEPSGEPTEEAASTPPAQPEEDPAAGPQPGPASAPPKPAPAKQRRKTDGGQRKPRPPKAGDPDYLPFHTSPSIEAPVPIPYAGPLPEGVVYVATAEELPPISPRAEHPIGFDLETWSGRTDLWRHVARLHPFLGGRIRLAQLAIPSGKVWIVDVALIGQPAIDWLSELVRNPERTLIGHNLLFEASHLRAAGIRPLCRWWDTMLASQLIGDLPRQSLEAVAAHYLKRPMDKAAQTSQWGGALTEEQIAYAATDARILHPLQEALQGALARTDQLEAHRLDCGMVSACADGQDAGLRIDTAALASVVIEAKATRSGKVRELHQMLGIRNYRSGDQLHPALQAAVGAELRKRKADDADGNPVYVPSTSAEVLRPFAEHPAVALLLELRDLDQTLKEATWLQGDAAIGGGRTRPSYRILGARTGRTTTSAQLGKTAKSGSVPSDTQRYGEEAKQAGQPHRVRLPQIGCNFQGLTGRTRAALVADPGHVLVDLDWSSIEVRLQASTRLYRDTGQRRIVLEGIDPHCSIASQVCGRPIGKDDPERAAIGKVANFSLAYGCGVRNLQSQLAVAQGRPVSREEAQRVYDAWHRSHPEISRRMDLFGDRNDPVLEVRSVSRRRLRTQTFKPDPQTGLLGTLPLSRPNGINLPIQASGKDLLADAVGELWHRLDAFPEVRVVGLIHDEILLSVPEAQAEEVKALALEVMTSARLQETYLGDIPLEADANVATSWGEAH
ncbi:hypothetical protein EVJ50_06760 [Synechococcus sp. RSCCF101]|uniref:DNA polymerase n=1 Tax=Synechococcus sp. RSCCF101 TaxID=2511069 RepID=UPI0012481FD2|nr:DNA polymerase [Synechococcus sp. RSCCF101]QEY31981.1 hypothetical protein EVJ50_06760 [Synechococcus sp. RSCCF101]